MKHRQFFSMLALGLFATVTLSSEAQAQTLVIGRGGVRYNAYGQGYYGGYGHQNNGYFPNTYTGYGNGPYGYGSARQFRSFRGTNIQNGAYYNGYSTSGYHVRPQARVYSPYGYGVNSYYGW
jgi:hypothetical protein